MDAPTILVTTPTGNVGSRLVTLLIQAGLRPRVLCREPAKLAEEVREHSDVRTGDQLDAGAVADAVAGVDAVYWVSPEVFTAADPLADIRIMADHLVMAVRTHRTRRVVLQSSVGAEVRHGAGLIDGLAYAETELDAVAAELGTEVLHLRCGYFFTNLFGSLEPLAAGTLPTTQDPELATAWVDPRDIAEVAAVRLLASGWSGRVVQAVHGPRDLSFAAVAAILSKVLGRQIAVAPGSDADARAGLIGAGLSPSAADGIVGMTAGLRDFTPEQPRDLTTTTPSTLEAWAHTVLRPVMSRS